MLSLPLRREGSGRNVASAPSGASWLSYRSCPLRFGQAASGRVPPLTRTANVMRYPPPDSAGIRAALFGSVSFLIEEPHSLLAPYRLSGQRLKKKKKKKKIYFLSGTLSSSLRFLACFPPAGPPGCSPQGKQSV